MDLGEFFEVVRGVLEDLKSLCRFRRIVVELGECGKIRDVIYPIHSIVHNSSQSKPMNEIFKL